VTIHRQIGNNLGRRGERDISEISDQESDDDASDAEIFHQFNPQGSSVYGGRNCSAASLHSEDLDNHPQHFRSVNPHDPASMYASHYDSESEPAPQHLIPQDEEYDRILSRPVTPYLNDYGNSQLSLTSIMADRDDFALSKVEETFTDADGKYLKQFSSELHKIDPKTSKGDLCIREYVIRSEKQWSDDVRNKKLGFDTQDHHKRPSSQFSDDRSMSISPPESVLEEPLFGYKPPRGVKLFLQRRIGDWPLYSILLALVCFLPRCPLIHRAKSSQAARFNSPFLPIRLHKKPRNCISLHRYTLSHQ
jgi:alpha-1,3-glucan synthase